MNFTPASLLNISPTMCDSPPVPDEPKLTLPPDLPRATTSAGLFNGEFAATQSIVGTMVAMVTGWKSFSTS